MIRWIPESEPHGATADPLDIAELWSYPLVLRTMKRRNLYRLIVTSWKGKTPLYDA